MHPYFAIRATEEHRREMEQAANRRRAVPPAPRNPLRRQERLRTHMGLALVGLGLRLAGPLRVPTVRSCEAGGALQPLTGSH